MKKSPYSRCSRCGNNMIHESFLGPTEQFTGLKCVMCGEVIDPVILQNRELMRTGQMIIPSTQRKAASEYIHA